MVSPGGIGEVDSGLLGVKFRKKEASEMDGACSGDSLQSTDLYGEGRKDIPLAFCLLSDGSFDVRGNYPIFLDGGAVGANDELLRGRCEVRQTTDGEVFVIQIRVIVNSVIGLANSL